MGECDWEEVKTIHLSRQKMDGAGGMQGWRGFVRTDEGKILRFYTKKK